jgi:WD40 repeat protein/serine/threonine protein kinase/DNA-binding XRE family transcriptional regulator
MSGEQSFGQLVKTRRRELGLTQDELARRVGCAPVTIRKIEYDDLRPSVQIAERLAMALTIPLEERAAFVRLAREERAQFIEPTPTPAPLAEEIGAQDLSGRAVRGYALAELVGAGGMGVVYRAVQPLVEREVAIKIILPSYANQPDFIRRFEAEAQLVARLEHPHIVPLYDYWREPNVAYLVMRMLRGGSVQRLLQDGQLQPDQVLRIIEQIGSALGTAHRAGVVHRDLKPANVLLDEDNNAYLADFGIAKNLSNPNIEDVTNADAIVGSPDYISPEQIRSEFVRPQTDIYCLGVMLYEMLTGVVPFQGATPIHIMHQHLTAPLPPLAANRVGLPRKVDEVIAQATAKDALERYANVESMLVDLRQALSKNEGRESRELNVNLQSSNPPILTSADNPYKGLRAFGEGDTHDFFGRDSLIQQLLVRLGEGGDLSRLLAVVGPSGSGKSSVVKAGLIPALRRGGLPGSDNWFIVEMIPGAFPLEELESALLRVAVNPPETLLNQLREDKRGLLRAVLRCLPYDPNVELVLVIDQFEEVFTLVQEEATRAHFLDLLLTAALDERSRIRIVLTLRADFIDRPLNYVDFGEVLRQRLEMVLPLTPDELEQAIVKPAERINLEIEPGLVPLILHDVGDQSSALPLLEYALTELFEKSVVGAIRESPLLTKSAYQSIGGVSGALGRKAEEVYSSLDKAGRAVARQIFLRLVTLGEGVEDTRRRVLKSEIESLADSAKSQKSTITHVIENFARSRLLSLDRDPGTRGPTLEVAHEALLREWPRLREWLSECRADVRMQRQLAQAAQEWQSANQEQSFLLTGSRLIQFESGAANTTVALTQDERAFLEASVVERNNRVAEERERQQRELSLQKRAANGLRILVGALTIFLVVAVGLTALAFNRQTEAQNNFVRAEQEARVASARELAAASLNNLDINTERSILLALQSVNETYSVDGTTLPEAEEALHEAVQTSRLQLTLDGHTDTVWYATFSPDGNLIATGSEDGTVKIWDASTGNEIVSLQASAFRGVNGVAFSPDGTLLASADADSTIRIWGVPSGREQLTLRGHTDRVQSVAFSPDGTRLASTSNDHTVRLWDVDTGKELFALKEDSSGEIYWIDFNSDGSQIVIAAQTTNEGWASVWDLDARQKVFTFSKSVSRVSSASFSPDDAYLVTTAYDQTAKLWAAKTGRLVLTFFGHTDGVTDAAFSLDGKRLATSSWDRHVKIWDVATGQEIIDLAGHDRDVNTVAFSVDGNRVVTASVDKTVKIWNVGAIHEGLTFTFGPKIEFIEGAELAYSPDGPDWSSQTQTQLPKFGRLKQARSS